MAVLGIDTSNYRTSLCLINRQFEVLSEQNPLLSVEQGALGLQQSTAVFEHLKTVPTLLEHLPVQEPIEAVGVSVSPRPYAHSYMPVFKVGEALAEMLAHFLSVPLFKTSHQEGHIAAGEYAAPKRPGQPSFLAVHISGGTSEVCLCTRVGNEGRSGYDIERLGHSLDLHAGQLVDRVGIKLNLPFPAGPYLEKLAREWAQRQEATEQEEVPVIPSFVQGTEFSFSGPETAALRMIEEGAYEPGQIARAVEKNIAKTLEKVLLNAMDKTKCEEILIVGGVAANQYIKAHLQKRLAHRAVGGKLFFAAPQYATDNAYGVACLALQQVL